MPTLFLIRHGLIDYNTMRLNVDGQAFAKKLPDILPVVSLGFIATDECQRCQQTVAALADRFSVDPTTFNKCDFFSGRVLNCCLSYETSVVCYRREAVNPILTALRVPEFTEGEFDQAYEFIWEVQVDQCADLVCKRKIKTGFSKGLEP